MGYIKEFSEDTQT